VCEDHTLARKENAMRSFLQKHAASVIGILSGFDRLVFRGTMRNMAFAEGLMRYLSLNHILLKDAGAHFEEVSGRVKAASVRLAEEQRRPVQYLPSAQTRKELVAREIAQRDGVSEGLVCVLSTVEVCWSFEVHRHREARRLELRACPRKCLHYYHYWMHPQLGLMHARLQTWFPFTMQVCMNGREWLARTLDREGLGYRKSDNCFRWLADAERAQCLATAQLRTDWPGLLDGLARQINPLCPGVFGRFETAYYWSAHQTEWATDVMFKTPEALAALYPRLIRHGMNTFHSADVMRFLGQHVSATGTIHGRFKGEVVSDLKTRPEGLRLKHRVGRNSVKLYDKQGSVLRIETTINDPRALTVYRPAEGGPPEQLRWRPMRRGVADVQRRAAVSQACNERYLEALAQADDTQLLQTLLAPVCQPVRRGHRRARALQPFGMDGALLDVLGRGEFALNGFRNRDLQTHLYTDRASSAVEQRRRSARVTRTLRLLRLHGLIRKVPKTHRYQLTALGRTVIVALGAAKHASVSRLSTLAA
jgi:hypothetical protein